MLPVRRPRWEGSVFFLHGLSMSYHNKFYVFENNKKYKQKQKVHWKTERRKCRSHLHHRLFSNVFIFDQLNSFSMPMGTVNIRQIR